MTHRHTFAYVMAAITCRDVRQSAKLAAASYGSDAHTRVALAALAELSKSFVPEKQCPLS